MVTFSSKQLDGFHKAALSLKLFSRAELNDEKNRSLIEKLYVDPLPNDQVFKTLLANNTTILIGRKGSGKSTVFQRVQHEVRKSRSSVISAYMDIRNVYEASQIDPITADKINAFDSALSPEQVQRFLLYKRFFKSLIVDIRNELKAQVDQSFLTRLRERVAGTAAEVFAGLDQLIQKLDNPDYENIEGFVSKAHKSTAVQNEKITRNVSAEGSAALSAASIKASGSRSSELGEQQGTEDVYTQLLMRVIGVNEVIQQLKSILNALGVKSLYIFLDDFSELPEPEMKILVDALISPLSRWSDFIKFKIAAYPGRVYLGSLDKTKVEEFNLDIFGLYGGSGVAKMEDKSIDFVRRVVDKRVQHFSKIDPSIYFGSVSPEVWRTLFYASMGNPRILGHILLYVYESNLIYSKRIGPQAVSDAAQRYYDEKVAPFFLTGKYKVTFDERSSVFSLRELLESLVSKARGLRQEGSRENPRLKQRSFASHFYVANEYEDLLKSLELTFFITKYFEQSDRDGVRVSIYALNYGLCNKYQIGFGRPRDRREDRLFFVERRFDSNSVVRSYISNNQEIKCISCNEEYDLDMLPALPVFMMKCPKCNGQCNVVNLSKKYGDMLETVSAELLLPDTELGILQTLRGEAQPMVAAAIAGELDCSGQLVGRRAKNLAEKALLTRESIGSVYQYSLTAQAVSAYFSDPAATELDLADNRPASG